MKTLLLILAFGSISVANEPVREIIHYNCSSFKKDDMTVTGARAPAIVSIPGDSTGGKALYVRTAPMVPNPIYSYHLLTKTFQGVDATKYTSDEFEVNIFYVGGGRAHIQYKNSNIAATCVSQMWL